jgi:hypothetical protein
MGKVGEMRKVGKSKPKFFSRLSEHPENNDA